MLQFKIGLKPNLNMCCGVHACRLSTPFYVCDWLIIGLLVVHFCVCFPVPIPYTKRCVEKQILNIYLIFSRSLVLPNLLWSLWSYTWCMNDQFDTPNKFCVCLAAPLSIFSLSCNAYKYENKNRHNYSEKEYCFMRILGRIPVLRE